MSVKDVAENLFLQPMLARRQAVEAVITDVLKEAASKNALSGVEVAVDLKSGFHVNARQGAVETIEQQRDKALQIQVYRKGGSKGAASSSIWHLDAIRKTLDRACDIARFTAPDDCSALAEERLMATDFQDLDIYHPWAIDLEQAIAQAVSCEAAARDYSGLISNTEGASIDSFESCVGYGNSHGFVGSYGQSEHHIGCCVIAGKGDTMQRDYAYDSCRRASDLRDLTAIGQQAAQRTVARMSPRPIATGRYPVLFTAEVSCGLIRHLVASLRGSALYRRASFLCDSLGKEVMAADISLVEEPWLERGMASAPFDGEGVRTQRQRLVSAGKLQSYLLDSYSARKLGMENNGHAGGVRNLLLQPGKEDRASLCRQMGRGILVAEVIGMGVNLVTGDYSQGASGFFVDGGEIQHPVEEITVAGRLDEMFRGIVARGREVDRRGRIHCPDLLIDGLTIAAS